MRNRVANKLNESEIREILKRAEEIHLGSSEQLESDTKSLIKAAEEAGLPREAVEQALRERLESKSFDPTLGEFIFAPSADGKLYVAEVMESQSSQIRVKFLNGSESVVDSQQCQVANFLPSSKVQANWPAFGWWTCTVLSYDKPNRLVRLSDGWGSEKTFPLTEIRINAPVQQQNTQGLNRFFQANPTLGYVILGLVILVLGIIMSNT